MTIICVGKLSVPPVPSGLDLVISEDASPPWLFATEVAVPPDEPASLDSELTGLSDDEPGLLLVSVLLEDVLSCELTALFDELPAEELLAAELLEAEPLEAELLEEELLEAELLVAELLDGTLLLPPPV